MFMCRWRGDHAGSVNKLFPANYVQVVENGAQGEDGSAPAEAMLHLKDCHIGRSAGVFFCEKFLFYLVAFILCM